MNGLENVRLDRSLIDSLCQLPVLQNHDRLLRELEGLSLPVALVDPAEVADVYQVRGEIARSAGRTVHGQAEFVSALREATGSVRIGLIKAGRATVVVILEADSPTPVRWMVVEG